MLCLSLRSACIDYLEIPFLTPAEPLACQRFNHAAPTHEPQPRCRVASMRPCGQSARMNGRCRDAHP